jgi:TolA-binding protein
MGIITDKKGEETLEQRISKRKSKIAEMQKYLDETTLPEDSEGGRKDIQSQMDAISREGREDELAARVKKAAADEKVRAAREATEKQAKVDAYNNKM